MPQHECGPGCWLLTSSGFYANWQILAGSELVFVVWILLCILQEVVKVVKWLPTQLTASHADERCFTDCQLYTYVCMLSMWHKKCGQLCVAPKPIESAAKPELNIPPEPAILPFKFRLLPTTRRQKNTPHLQDTNAGSIFLETVIHPKQAILEERQFLVDSLVSAEATVP